MAEAKSTLWRFNHKNHANVTKNKITKKYQPEFFIFVSIYRIETKFQLICDTKYILMLFFALFTSLTDLSSKMSNFAEKHFE